MTYYLGVDTGGTFTDFVLLDAHSRELRLHKVLSTPHAPELAILQGIDELGVGTDKLVLVHGSTVATNAVLEGKGVKTVYITNRGLADILTIGRQARAELYNLMPEKPLPLIPADQCLEVNSRLSATGEALEELDDTDLEQLAQALLRQAPAAVAINLLFSFLDDTEETRIARLVAELAGTSHEAGQMPENVFVSRSSDVLPESGEFERGITTSLNAMVGPLMQGYLQRLQDGLSPSPISVMQSTATTTSVDQAGLYPVNLLLSGPAGGLVAARTIARTCGTGRLLTFDMGGTSTDVSIIDGEIAFTSGAHIGGHPVAVPMIDMHTIGAGGGSIARVDEGGMLLVGPESAGASPGPACYGKGGDTATVTDANVVLGRIPASAALAGDMQLDSAAASKAVAKLAQALASTEEQVAAGIIDIVNEHMVRALRVMSVERGENPKDFALVAFGGAGGLHVCALADALEMEKAVMPVNAGVLSALGMLAAVPGRERSRSINTLVNEVDRRQLNKVFHELQSQAISELEKGLATSGSNSIEVHYSVDVRYKGQSHCLNVALADINSGNDSAMLQTLVSNFHQAHEQQYGHQLTMPVEMVNLRVHAMLRQEPFVLPAWQATEQRHEQKVSVSGEAEPVVMLNRMSLQSGDSLTGPMLIVESSATLWLAPGWQANVDDYGNLILTRPGNET